MITTVPGNYRNEYYGLSTDEKPINGVPNASEFKTIDTCELFMFDAENMRWCEQSTRPDQRDDEESRSDIVGIGQVDFMTLQE